MNTDLTYKQPWRKKAIWPTPPTRGPSIPLTKNTSEGKSTYQNGAGPELGEGPQIVGRMARGGINYRRVTNSAPGSFKTPLAADKANAGVLSRLGRFMTVEKHLCGEGDRGP